MEPIVHLKQREVRNDKTRHQFLLVGRRGGKTTYFVEDIMESIPSCPPGGKIFYIGPTNQSAMELIWDPLLEALDSLGWKYQEKISKHCIELSRGRKVYIIGAEKIRRIRGHKVYRVYLDEIAFYNESLNNIWKAVRPTLTDLKGKARIGTTPNGKGTDAYDFYLNAQGNPQWKTFHWSSINNPFLEASEIEDAKADMDEKSFNQEYEATWESFEGLCYYNFNENIHIKNCSKIDWDHPMGITYDFNVNPTTLLFVQSIRDKIFAKKEFSMKPGSTIETTKQFCSWIKNEAPTPDHRIKVDIHGDSAGNNRHSSTGWSDYQYVEEVLKEEGINYEIKVISRNPHPPARLSHVNAWLRNVKGESRIEIDPGCRELVRDLSSQELEQGSRYPSDKNNLGHKADAFGYFICWKQLIGGDRKSSVIIL